MGGVGEAFEMVLLRSGEASVRERASGEIMHPAVGPWREARLLYVEQTRLAERLRESGKGPVRVLDVGLGAATNALAAIACAREVGGRALTLTSLERDLAPLRLVLEHPEAFPVQAAERATLEELAARGSVTRPGLRWHLLEGDALAELTRVETGQDLIFFDPFSPEANGALWTVEALGRLRGLLAPGGLLATYSASTRTRVTLLLVGFWVGAGAGVGAKRETTVAALGPGPLVQPLGARWLERWRRSTARAPHGRTLLARDEAEVLSHPQFAGPVP